jgi:hypothetical protein
MELDKKYVNFNKQELFNLLLSIVAVAVLAVSTVNYVDNKKRIVTEEKFITEALAFMDIQTKRFKKITAREEYSDKLFMTGQFDKETSERMAILAELTGYKLKNLEGESVEEGETASQKNKDSM